MGGLGFDLKLPRRCEYLRDYCALLEGEPLLLGLNASNFFFFFERQFTVDDLLVGRSVYSSMLPSSLHVELLLYLHFMFYTRNRLRTVKLGRQNGLKASIPSKPTHCQTRVLLMDTAMVRPTVRPKNVYAWIKLHSTSYDLATGVLSTARTPKDLR